MEVDGGVAARQEGQHQADFGASASFFLSVFPFFFAELLLMDGCSLLPLQGHPAPVRNAYYYNLNPIQQYAVWPFRVISSDERSAQKVRLKEWKQKGRKHNMRILSSPVAHRPSLAQTTSCIQKEIRRYHNWQALYISLFLFLLFVVLFSFFLDSLIM